MGHENSYSFDWFDFKSYIIVIQTKLSSIFKVNLLELTRTAPSN